MATKKKPAKKKPAKKKSGSKKKKQYGFVGGGNRLSFDGGLSKQCNVFIFWKTSHFIRRLLFLPKNNYFTPVSGRQYCALINTLLNM